ncbi:ClpP/crotonase-like domain-containing protein [Phlebopus sp. FC_14]|nr:ClpP/crotonase-like domain-containing protein [Phlebopus sp. FC_14]
MSSNGVLTFPISLPQSDPLLTITHAHDGFWVIELHNGEDSRLTKRLIDLALRPALDIVEDHWKRSRRPLDANVRGKEEKTRGAEGALIIVGKRSQDKFFSNGFDYESIKDDLQFFTNSANPLLARLLTYPIPTIAAINGHCFAAGMMLALSCDYRVMTDGSRRRAWMCMNEVHFGAPWPLSFTAILSAKVSDSGIRRRIALEGYRFTPSEALVAGIVDRVASCSGSGTELGTDGVLNEAFNLAKELSPLAKSGVWGSIKTFLYRGCLEMVRQDTQMHAVVAAKL